MKRFFKSAAASALSCVMAATAFSGMPVLAAETAALPDWIPDTYEEAVDFLNRYGHTHVNEYVCIVQEAAGENSNYTDQFMVNGMSDSILVSSKIYSVKAEDPGKDDGSEDYYARLRAYENYQNLLKNVGEKGVNEAPKYQVLIFLPNKTGAFSIRVWKEPDFVVDPVESSDGVPAVVNTSIGDMEYTFEQTAAGCTETDLFSWLPDCRTELEDYMLYNGAISLHDDGVVVCTDVNYSTGADLLFGQTGNTFVNWYTANIPRYTVRAPMLAGGESSVSISIYKAKAEGRTVFSQFIGRLFDDSPAKVTTKAVIAKKDGDKMSLKMTEAVPADLNADGNLNNDDLHLISGYLTEGNTLDTAQTILADFNGDKIVDARDLTMIKRKMITESRTPAITTGAAEATTGGWGIGGGGMDSPGVGPEAGDWGGWSEGKSGWDGPGESNGILDPTVPAIQPSSGVLTAGEWNDNENWEFFSELVHKGLVTFPSFGMDPVYRVALTVTNNGEPVPNQRVTMTGGTAEWSAVTDRSGVALLFYSKEDAGKEMTVEADGKTILTFTAPEEKSDQTGILVPDTAYTAELNADFTNYDKTEVMFIIDTTGSMGDEIAYLQKDFEKIAEDVDTGDISFSVNFYRDEGDDYVTRCNPFTDDVSEVIRLIDNERADGGGDLPEAVAQILEETLVQGDWHQGTNKIAFLIFDAPPHKGDKENKQIEAAVKAAAAKGIRVVPVVASNADRDTELFARALSIMTNGNYVFLTDDSGVGGSHLEPIIGEYTVELLHDIIVRNILEAAGFTAQDTWTVPQEQEGQTEQPAA